jgi:2,3-bisphosphoglycerate-independent phosphoglycerate mutase
MKDTIIGDVLEFVEHPEYKGEYDLTLNEGLGISSLAATCLELMGYEAPEGYDPAVMNMK